VKISGGVWHGTPEKSQIKKSTLEVHEIWLLLLIVKILLLDFARLKKPGNI
jgi:hypothetical protein